MKKLIWMACAFSCAILSMLADHTVNGYTYNYEILYSGVQPSGVNIRPIFNSSSHNTASAVSPIPTGDFVIPEYLPYDSTNFLPVMNIGYQPDFGRYAGTAKAFSSPYMTSVVIPDTVTNIDLAAFADCTALISVKLPS